MARTISADLAAILALEGAQTYSTLRLIFRNGSEARYSTLDITIAAAGGAFSAGLLETGELQQTLGETANRLRVRIQNIDKAAGILAISEMYAGATAIVGRLFRATGLTDAWEETFRGEAIVTEINEETLELEIVADLIAAGYTIASRTLAARCQFTYKDPLTCGYSGPLRTCSKSRKGPNGCQEHDNLGDDYKFGGFEYPDVQPTEPTAGDGGGGGIIWGGGCFPAGTLVLLPGFVSVPIEQIRPGDWVLSFNGNLELTERRVKQVFVHQAEARSLIRIDGELEATPEHKILEGQAPRLGMTPARDLAIGSVLHRLTGIGSAAEGLIKTAFFIDWPIEHIERIELEDPITVYNLEVEIDHAYFADRFAVSNSKDPGDV